MPYTLAHIENGCQHPTISFMKLTEWPAVGLLVGLASGCRGAVEMSICGFALTTTTTPTTTAQLPQYTPPPVSCAS
uniref:Uncharacterized protein n=1 Tax=Anguilla anguilla TaxID=7936 RepID=A0A0E9QM52_ANGAN